MNSSHTLVKDHLWSLVYVRLREPFYKDIEKTIVPETAFVSLYRYIESIFVSWARTVQDTSIFEKTVNISPEQCDCLLQQFEVFLEKETSASGDLPGSFFCLQRHDETIQVKKLFICFVLEG